MVFRAFQHHALPLDAGGFEFRPQAFAEGGVAVLATLQQQPTVWNLLKQARPLADQLRVDLGRVVQAAEGHIAVCGGRQRAHRRRVLRWHIADVVVGHPDQLLQIVRVATRWRFHRVTDQVINGIQPGGVDQTAHPFNDQRRRFPGDQSQAVAVGVAAQVDQNVHLILLYQRFHGGVRTAGNVMPFVCDRPHPCGEHIFQIASGIYR